MPADYICAGKLDIFRAARPCSHSNYLSGDDKGGVSVRAVLEQFGKKRGAAIRQYRKFITEGLGDGHREEYYKVIDQRFLGDEEFVLQDLSMRYLDPS